MAEFPTPDNLARLPPELQRQIGSYLRKEEPAQCTIKTVFDSRHGDIINYWITRIDKPKFFYAVPEFYFGCLKFEGLEAFLALKSCPIGQNEVKVKVYFEECDAKPDLTFSLSAEEIKGESFVVYHPACNFPSPGAVFKYRFFKAAFDNMLRDLDRRNVETQVRYGKK